MYSCEVTNGSGYSRFQDEGYLIHKPFPVDEEVWLTREGVAHGEDTVVKRALAWMDSLAYAHDVHVDPDTVGGATDSIRITAKVRNAAQHTLVVSAIVTNGQGSLVDSVVFMHAAGDTLWSAYTKIPDTIGTYDISVRTDDATSGSYRRLPNVASFAIVTDIEENPSLPDHFALEQNYPNPFNPSTTISYVLPVTSHVSLTVYDLLGREIAVLVNGVQQPGRRVAIWDASGIASGIYYYRLTAGTFVAAKAMVVLK